jgi:hypothetical protein
MKLFSNKKSSTPTSPDLYSWARNVSQDCVADFHLSHQATYQMLGHGWVNTPVIQAALDREHGSLLISTSEQSAKLATTMLDEAANIVAMIGMEETLVRVFAATGGPIFYFKSESWEYYLKPDSVVLS